MADLVFPDPRLVDLLRSMNSAMPPWEAYSWFDSPTETVYVGLATGARIAAHDVRRVILLIGLNGASDSCRLTITPGSGSANGFLLDSGTPFILFTHQQHALLTQIDWYVGSAPAGPLCVIEVRLRAWPGGDPIG